jgi:hypothetical protein
MVPFWKSVVGRAVLQGDWIPDCKIPVFRTKDDSDELHEEVTLDASDLIVVSQSCDLENDKIQFVALCPIFSREDFDSQQINPLGKRWEEVRKGRHEGLHLLASPTDPADSLASLVVDFRLVVSLPIDYVRRRAESAGPALAARLAIPRAFFAGLRTILHEGRSPLRDTAVQVQVDRFVRRGLPTGATTVLECRPYPTGWPRAPRRTCSRARF